MRKTIFGLVAILALSVVFAAIEYGEEATELSEPFQISLDKTIILDSGYELPVIVPVDNRSLIVPVNESVAIVIPLYKGRPALMEYRLLCTVDRTFKKEYKNMPKKWLYPRIIRVSYNNVTKWFLLRMIAILPHGQDLESMLQYYDNAYIQDGTLIVTIPGLDNEPVVIPVIGGDSLIIPLDGHGPGIVIQDGSLYLFDNVIETDNSVLLKRASPPVLVPIYDTPALDWPNYTREIGSI